MLTGSRLITYFALSTDTWLLRPRDGFFNKFTSEVPLEFILLLSFFHQWDEKEHRFQEGVTGKSGLPSVEVDQ